MKKIIAYGILTMMLVTGCSVGGEGKPSSPTVKTKEQIRQEALQNRFVVQYYGGEHEIHLDTQTNCQYLYVNKYREGGLVSLNQKNPNTQQVEQICSDVEAKKIFDQFVEEMYQKQFK